MHVSAVSDLALPQSHPADTGAGARSTWPAVVDCDKVKSMPDVTLSIGGKDWLLKPTDYVLQVGGC